MDTAGSEIVESGREGGAERRNGHRRAALALALPEELFEAIAERAAEIVVRRAASADDEWLRGAERIAAYIDCSRNRVYALTSARRIPVHRDGTALVARRSELDRWLSEGGGRRP